MMSITLPTEIAGFTPGAYGIWTLVALAIVTLIKGWPQLKQIQVGADQSMRTELFARITALEKHVEALEKQLADDQRRHAAEMQLLRHRLNNETAALDAVLLLVEAAPEKLMDNLARIKEMRAESKAAIALESGAMAGAMVAATEKRANK